MIARYLWYLIRHKWYVFIECCKLGIPWLGIIHDLSKFLPSEFMPYARHFYGRDKSCDLAFDTAWFWHQKRNKHHWQFWVLREDDGNTIALQMPDRYMYEMVADWKGAGRALGKPDTRAWYLDQKDKNRQLLHAATRSWIEEILLPVEATP